MCKSILRSEKLKKLVEKELKNKRRSMQTEKVNYSQYDNAV